MRKGFLDTVPKEKRIQTIASCRHTMQSLSNLPINSDHLLIVGGNEKGNGNLTTVESVKILRDRMEETTIWATANPNSESSVSSVSEKLGSGVSGIVLQPILSSKAASILEEYPSEITYVAGMALPRTAKGLIFWETLLQQPDLSDDPLFQQHLSHFMDGRASLSWAQGQLALIESIPCISGVHFMPLKNTKDLLSLLQRGDSWLVRWRILWTFNTSEPSFNRLNVENGADRTIYADGVCAQFAIVLGASLLLWSSAMETWSFSTCFTTIPWLVAPVGIQTACLLFRRRIPMNESVAPCPWQLLQSWARDGDTKSSALTSQNISMMNSNIVAQNVAYTTILYIIYTYPCVFYHYGMVWWL